MLRPILVMCALAAVLAVPFDVTTNEYQTGPAPDQAVSSLMPDAPFLTVRTDNFPDLYLDYYAVVHWDLSQAPFEGHHLDYITVFEESTGAQASAARLYPACNCETAPRSGAYALQGKTGSVRIPVPEASADFYVVFYSANANTLYRYRAGRLQCRRLPAINTAEWTWVQ